jgi:NAD(P)-dependent dehydrogenase (short-subunit alcohol dehydrogenase family)
MQITGSGPVALVVGGGTGMGYAAADRLAGRGVRLVLSARRHSALLDAQRRIREAHSRTDVQILAGDAGNEGQAQAMVEAAIQHFGRLDILVNAAGIYEAVSFSDLDGNSWRRTLGATLDAMVFPSIASVREMKKVGGGRIVLISSINAVTSEPDATAYNSAKSAVGGLVRSIVVDCSKDGIQANAVAPGWVYTPMVASYIDGAESEVMDRINPLGRAADADEIGNVVEYLALDAPSFLTGSTITVDGGQTIRAAMP